MFHMPSISVRIAHAPAGTYVGQRRHDMRSGRVPGYVNPLATPDNSVILAPPPPADLRDLCIARRSARVPPPRLSFARNSAVATMGIITFSIDAQPILSQLPHSAQDALFRVAAESLALEMGTTLSGLVVHRDESALHAHFTCPAVQLDGMPVSKGVDTRRLQDVAAGAFAHLGITRGVPKAVRQAAGEPRWKWVNRSVRELHADLPREILAAEARLEKNERLAAEAAAKLAAAGDELPKVRKRMEAYEHRAAEARQELDRLRGMVNLPQPQEIALAAPKSGILGHLGRFLGLNPLESREALAYHPNAVGRLIEEQAARAARADAFAEQARVATDENAWLVSQAAQMVERLALAEGDQARLNELREALSQLDLTPEMVLQAAQERHQAAQEPQPPSPSPRLR